MTEDELRKEFEAYCNKRGLPIGKNELGGYLNEEITYFFDIWQAATELAEKRHTEEIAKLKEEIEYWKGE